MIIQLRPIASIHGSSRIVFTENLLRFRLMRLAIIRDIPTAQFNSIVSELIDCGWRKRYEYKGFDAWIDYGCIRLKQGGHTLTCEWDNWFEGSIRGPRVIIRELAADHGLVASDRLDEDCSAPGSE